MSHGVRTEQVQVAKQAVWGTMWVFLSFVLGKTLTFVATIILARLLAPEHYGLMGYCLAAMNYLDVLNSFGMGAALISRRDKVEEAANAAFVISIGIGLLLFIGAWLAAPGIARFFKEAEVVDLFRVLAIYLPISALSTVPNAIIKRQLRFKIKLIPELGSNLAKGGLSILFAWAGFGTWSLVWGYLGGTIVGTTLYWTLAKWRPTFVFDWQATREMLSFGIHIIIIALAGALMANFDYIVVGRLLGTIALGYYVFAYRVPEIIIASINNLVDKVAYPLLAQLQSDVDKLQSTYIGYLRYIAIFTFPASVGLALISGPFLRIAAPRWEPATLVMQLIALKMGIISIGYVPGVLYKATNRPHILNQLAIVKIPCTIALLWLGAHWNIEGVAAAHLIVALLNVALDTVVASYVLKFQISSTFKALLPAFTGSVVMALVVAGVGMPLAAAPDLVQLIGFILVGSLSYIGALVLVDRDGMARASRTFRAALSG